MSAYEFRGDDAGYLSWLQTHPAGYLINIHKNYNPADARMHHASCYTLRTQRGTQTDPYVKVCADQLAGLETWAIEIVGGAKIQPCRSCNARLRPR
ncbi:MAG: hypothetical protein JWR37_5500 [Mycobacterium sp.]|nr:hypothetical protein [Mycobacterium sp.]